MDRRVLADLALQEPEAFGALVEKAKDALAEGAEGAEGASAKGAEAA